MLTEERLYELAYNAHEWAEAAALEAMRACLASQDEAALMCLADPEWRWETRSSLSVYIIEQASIVLDERLEALVA